MGTVFKRDLEQKYSLKMKTSRAFFSEVNARFPTLPFTLRAGKDERAWRMGVVECKNHGMFVEYPVLYEKAEEVVAQYKFTAQDMSKKKKKKNKKKEGEAEAK